MINLKNFARNMNVCPNTVRNWMNSGKLRPERHYLQSGRTIRFPWDEKFVKQLQEEWAKDLQPRPKLTSRSVNRARLRYRA